MSSQKIKKPKICKCGHRKDTHRKNPFSKIVITGNCKNCPCNKYMNRNRPDKSDRIMAFVLPLVFVLFVIWVLVMVYSMPLTEEQLKTPSNLTIGDLLEIFWIVSFLVFYWLACILVVDPIYEYFKQKRRETYPIQNSDGTLENDDNRKPANLS